MGSDDHAQEDAPEGWAVMDGSANSTASGGSGFDMTKDQAPDPMANPEEYADWCERHACTACDGEGQGFHEDEFNPESGTFGMPWTCHHCGGDGVEK